MLQVHIADIMVPGLESDWLMIEIPIVKRHTLVLNEIICLYAAVQSDETQYSPKICLTVTKNGDVRL